MTTILVPFLTPGAFNILDSLAATLGIPHRFSLSSRQADSDVNGWLGFVLGDANQSPAMNALRVQLATQLGSNVPLTAAQIFAYYIGLFSLNPITVPGLALWFDGNAQTYSDAAGTVPSSAPVGLVRRSNENAPLAGSWQSPSDPERGVRDAQAIRLDPTPNTALGQYLIRSGAATPLNNTTLVFSWRNRGGFGSLNDGLIGSLAPLLGLVGGFSLGIYYNGGSLWQPAFTVPRGAQATIGIRWTPTGIKAKILINGIAFTDSLAVTVNPGTSGDWYLGLNTNGSLGAYIHASQAIAVANALSDSLLDGLIAFADAKMLPPAFPLTSPLIFICGDSIAAVNPGTTRNLGWPCTILFNLRATTKGAGCEVLNAALSGSGTGIASYTGDAQLFVSRSRVKNIVIETAGTNDLALGTSPATVIANLTAIYAAVRADGGFAVGSTILPRTGSLSVSQATFDGNAATVNAWIRASVTGGFADAVADVAAISGMSTNADVAGPNFIGDGVHPGTLGHALMAPVYQAAVSSLL